MCSMHAHECMRVQYKVHECICLHYTHPGVYVCAVCMPMNMCVGSRGWDHMLSSIVFYISILNMIFH